METNSSNVAATRVCIKNIPTSFDEDNLKKFLSKESKVSLVVTDCKVLRRKSDGVSRKIAFVGLADIKQAQHIVTHFHRSYCLTSRLIVEHALTKNSTEDQIRPWSKHSKGSSKYEKINEKKEGKKKKKTTTNEEEPSSRRKKERKEDVDKKKEEFLAAMGIGKSKTRVWENDDNVAIERKDEPQNVENNETDQESSSSVASNDSSNSEGADADILQSSKSQRKVVGSAFTDLEFLRSKSSNKDDLDSDDDGEMEEENDQNSTSSDSSESSDSTEESSEDCVNKSSSVEILHKKDRSIDSDSHGERKKKMQEKSDEKNHIVQETNDEDEMIDLTHDRLFVRNLPFSTTEEDLNEHMLSYGSISECHIPVDDQKRNKGYAFITFESADSAARAKEALDGTDFQGRLIHVLPARKSANVEQEDLNENDPNLTYKQRQEILRRKEKSKTGWSASFVRGDAVVDNLAERLGLRKGDILNVKGDLSSGDAAVRLALGETHVIEENRKYFDDHGLDMEALVSVGGSKDDGASIKRSSDSILVKNLPFDTEKSELAKLFGSTGNDPEKILLPPSRTIALVQYKYSVDAKRAFKKLAFKRYKHVPLYLEWAPVAVKVSTEGKKDDQVDEAKENAEVEEELNDAPDSNVSFSIYIKNLSFSTTEDRLRACFENHVPVRAVKIPVKVEANTNSSTSEMDKRILSMGFGFVECDSEASVRKALNCLQGTMLDGHALELKRSTKNLGGKEKNVKPPKGKNPTKIMCRNVPFQATRKEILQLFGAFGQLKKVRLPKKYDGGHRGFAFVEFLTSQEAQSAMNALSRTHLYGRHLVLEWATDKDDMDTLRDKAKRDLTIDISLPSSNKRTKFQF